MDSDVVQDISDSLNIQEILELMPHRYPFLMVDKVVDIVPNVSCTGIKNVTVNEPYFAGHFPGLPVMPGVLMVEAMAQSAGLLVVHSDRAHYMGRNVFFLSIDSCRFRHPVVPGDTLQLRVRVLQHRRQIWRFRGEAFVGDRRVSEAVFAAMLAEEI